MKKFLDRALWLVILPGLILSLAACTFYRSCEERKPLPPVVDMSEANMTWYGSTNIHRLPPVK